MLVTPSAVFAEDARRNWFDDPFAHATNGYIGCPRARGPFLTADEMRQQAHERAERGTSCWLEGRCEGGGAYQHDKEINERVRAAIARDERFRRSSVWVTTQAQFVTLEGCVRNDEMRDALIALVKAQAGVMMVVDRTSIRLPPRKKPT